LKPASKSLLAQVQRVAPTEATVRYVLTAGSRVRIELIAQDSAQTIEVELTK